MRRLVKSKKILRNRNQNHNKLYTTPSTIGGCCIFYTDWHDVDEDQATIITYGGRWIDRDITGIAYRELSGWVNKSAASTIVASMRRHLRNL